MENFFFNINYTSFENTLSRFGVFLLISGVITYIIYFLFTKMLFKKSDYRKEIKIRLSFLWALLAYLVLFNIYLFFLIYIIGIDNFHWTEAKFYPGIIVQLLVYVLIAACFFIRRFSIKKIINQTTIS